MNISIEKNEATTKIILEGRLDTTTAPSLEKTIIENLDGTDNLILDMEKLSYISSAGLRVLLMAQKQTTNMSSYKLINVCDMVMEVFEMTGFADILTIE